MGPESITAMAVRISCKSIRSTRYAVRLLLAGILLHFTIEILLFVFCSKWKVGRDFRIPRSILEMQKAAEGANLSQRHLFDRTRIITVSESLNPSDRAHDVKIGSAPALGVPPAANLQIETFPDVRPRPYVIFSILRDPPKDPGADAGADASFWLQRIASTSWAHHFPRAAVHIWMDSADGCRAMAALPETRAARCSVIEDVSEEHGRPFLSTIWADAAATYPHSILVWLNGDIAIAPGLDVRLDAAFAAQPDAVVVSRRTDFDLPAGWAPEAGAAPAALLREVMANASHAGALHDPHGIDLFALPAESRIVAALPPFLVGVYRWDNWLVVWALRERIPLVDVSARGLLLHALVPANSARHSARRGAVYNYVLCKKEIGELYRLGSALNADYFLGGPGPPPGVVVPSRNQSVGVALARRMGAAGWLAVVAVDSAFLATARRWLCHARRASVSYHAFLALDNETRAALSAAGETVVAPSDFDMADDLALVAAAAAGPAGRAGPPWARREVVLAVRALVVGRIMEMGFSVIVADLDSLWVQDPLIALDSFATVQGQEEPGAAGLADGFLAVRGCTPGQLFWQKVCACLQRNLRALAAEAAPADPARLTLRACLDHYLDLFNRKSYYGFTSNVFPPKYFPTAAAFFEELASARQGVLPFVVHSNRRGLDDGPHAPAATLGAAPDCAPHPLRPDHAVAPLPDDEPHVAVPWPDSAGYPRYRIHIVTMARPRELQRLLESLRAGSYEGHSVALVLLVVHPGVDADERRLRRWEETYALCEGFRMGPGVVHHVVNRTFTGGLLSQWIDPWAAQDPGEILVTIEDTAEVLPTWFDFVTRVTQRYFAVDPAAGGDASLAGFGLQRQQAIIGQRPGLRFGRATPRAILSKEDTVYRYQLPMTWGGAVWFPHSWSAFRAWLLKVGLDKAHGVASLSTPCVPNFVTNQWWARDPSRFWSAWVIRFMFEHGLYFLYTNLPQHQCIALKEGEESTVYDGTDTSLVLPDLAALPLFDFHFRRVRSAEALRWNALILSPPGLDRCYSMDHSNGTDTYDADSHKQKNRVHRDDDHTTEDANARKRFIIISIFRDPPSSSPSDEETLARPPISAALFGLQRLACTSWWQRFPEENVGIHVWMDTMEGCRNVSSFPELKAAKCSILKHISEEHERPFIHTVWTEAAAEYPGRILIWLNSDTLVGSQILFDRIQSIFSVLPEAIAVSNGIEFNLSKPLDGDNFSRALEQITDSLRISKASTETFRIDMIALSAESPMISKLPPFLHGTTKWEAWLLYWSLVRERIPVVEISENGMLFHVGNAFNLSDSISESAAIYNDVLCKKDTGELFRISTVANADYIARPTSSGNSIEVVPNEGQSIAIDLARRVGSIGWIALVTVNEALLSIAYQWLCNARRAGIKYYTLLALDDASREALQGFNESIISLSDFDILEDLKSIKLESLSDQDVLKPSEIGAISSFVANQIIGFGFNVIVADLDNIWIQDPIKALDTVSMIQIPDHESKGLASGFIAIRSSASARKFWRAVCSCHKNQVLHSASSRSLECVDEVKDKFLLSRAEVISVKTLPLMLFPTSEAFYSISYSAREGALPYVVPLYSKEDNTKDARLARVKKAGLFYSQTLPGDVGTFHDCARHPLSPDYTLSSVQETNESVKTGWPIPQAPKLRFRIQIMVSSSQPKRLETLLQSLQAASYGGVQVAIVFIVVDTGMNAISEHQRARLKEETMSRCRSFRFPAGTVHQIVEFSSAAGAMSHWIDPWTAQDQNEILVALDESSEVYPSWFSFIIRVTKRYYKSDTAAGGDASLAGFGLLRQRAVIGQRPGLKTGNAMPHESLSKRDILYRYQLPMIGSGAVWFPHAWSAFRAWLQRLDVDKALGVARTVGPTPCVPNLVTNDRWARDPPRSWSAWAVRFMFERGFYFLYTNLPQRQTPIRDGADSVPFDAVDGLVLPDLAALPLFDLHLRRVPSAEALRWNSGVLSPPGLDPCFQHTAAEERPEEAA